MCTPIRFVGIRTLSSTTVLSVQLTACSPSLFHLGQQGPTHLFCVWCPQVPPHGLGTAIWRQCRQSDWSQDQQVFTPVHETTWLWRKLHPKFSCFSMRVQTCCTGLPARLPIKEIFGEPGLQSAASLGLCHTPHEHNLNHIIWTLYAESVSFSINATLLWGVPTPIYQATWCTPTPIYQATNLGRSQSNLSSKLGHAHSNLSSTLGRAHSNLSDN
jgi:hypothetical protein